MSSARDIRVPLNFDSIVSRTELLHGITQLTLSNGNVITVPTKVASRLPLGSSGKSSNPLNTVYGSCGYAYIYIEPDSNNSGVYGWAGWNVYSSVIGQAFCYEWGVDVENTTYILSTQFEWDSSISENNWNTGFYAIYGLGDYTAVATQAFGQSGYVFGTQGICSSAGPLVRSYTVVS